ncbi:flagellar export protein FliJ [Petrocella sp. FN5]|uniref:flagellar export protein FliJ n=1 Tax=Petrocella sp. FN5 TaxID=3032002 RepID=UPI0023DBDF93|nr:flagellar export protein FliJ [Petrocella sp. FN5]MDF1616828.1 flagellar export protein FliJ [Petrocella sp. FN5]
MAKFHYSMENILNVKTKIEEQKKMELAKAMMAHKVEIKKQEAIKAELDTTIEDFRERQKQSHSVSEFKRLSHNVNYYEKAYKAQKEVVVKAKEKVEAKRKALQNALEEKKIQEKLKEKALDVFIEEEKYKEIKMLDEIVGFRYSTKTDEE